MPLDPSLVETDVAGAKTRAKITSECFHTHGAALASVKETVEEYASPWYAWRECQGLGWVGDDRTLLARRIPFMALSAQKPPPVQGGNAGRAGRLV